MHALLPVEPPLSPPGVLLGRQDAGLNRRLLGNAVILFPRHPNNLDTESGVRQPAAASPARRISKWARVGIRIRRELGYTRSMSVEHSTIPAAEALARLKDGNTRYVQNVRSVDSMLSHSRRDITTQSPFAIVLGCSDSRAPAEIVFDQGLGDLFVIRVAGNIVAPSQVGSVEFAAERFGTRLVVVMGHTQCGAIHAAIEAISGAEGSASRNMMSIVNRVRPNIEGLMATDLARDSVRLHREAMRANVRASVNHLRHGSEVIERLAGEGGLAVVGSELDLATGEVTFFDDLARQTSPG
jgi:carbonic anhydrase